MTTAIVQRPATVFETYGIGAEGDWWDPRTWIPSVFGHSDAWFKNIASLQRDLDEMLAAVTEIDAPIWNAVYDGAKQDTFLAMKSFDDTKSDLRDTVSSLFVPPEFMTVEKNLKEQMLATLVVPTAGPLVLAYQAFASKIPSDSTISAAKRVLDKVQAQVAFVKKMTPEVAEKIQAAQDAARARTSAYTLESSTDAALKKLQEDLGKGVDWMKWILIGGAVVFGASYLGNMLRR